LSFELNASNQPIRKYFNETGIDDYFGHIEYSEVTNWQRLFEDTYPQGWYSYIKDQVGTVYKVWDQNTKQIVDNRTYDSFGNLISQAGTTKTPLGFQGKYYDAESGLNYFYHRYYNPAIGRFTSEDPIGLKGGINMFVLAGNDVINNVDPYGLDALANNEKVKNGICCILERSGRLLGDTYYGEKAFVAYTDFSIVYGKGTSGQRTTTDKFPTTNNGYAPAGYFHTHPSDGGDNSSREDIDIYNIFGNIYTLGRHRITEFTGKTSKMLGMITGIINWCIANRSKWEGECNKNCPKKTSSD
jgi:RHS repeat-associated protein